MMLEDVLGRGGGELLSLSSSGSEGAKWLPMAGRLNFHALLGLGGVAANCGRSGGREVRWMLLTVERLDPRLCEAARSVLRRNVEVELEDAGLCALALETGTEGRREEKASCKLRRGEGALKMPWVLRDLRGVLGVSDLALDCKRGTRVSEAQKTSRARDTYLRDMRVPGWGHAFGRLRLTNVRIDEDVTVGSRDAFWVRIDQRGRARLRIREIGESDGCRYRCHGIIQVDILDGGEVLLLFLDPLVGPAGAASASPVPGHHGGKCVVVGSQGSVQSTDGERGGGGRGLCGRICMSEHGMERGGEWIVRAYESQERGPCVHTYL